MPQLKPANKIHDLQNSITEVPLDVILITKTRGNYELKDAEFSVSGHKLFRKDNNDGRLGDRALLMIRDTVMQSSPLSISSDTTKF